MKHLKLIRIGRAALVPRIYGRDGYFEAPDLARATKYPHFAIDLIRSLQFLWHRFRRIAALGASALLVGLLPGQALARTESTATSEGRVEVAAEGAEVATPPSAAGTSDANHFLIGARYRGILVPSFYTSTFVEGGDTFYFNAVGPEFAIRKGDFEFNLSPWLAFYSTPPTPYKGKTDPVESWEIIESNLTLLYLTSDFLWDVEVASKLSVIYGFGAGFGLVFGDLTRLQAFPTPGSDPNDPDSYVPCVGPNVPNAQFCDPTDNMRFPGNDESLEPSFFNGGSKPPFFPWATLQTGLRYVPHPDFAVRLDIGIGTSGFLFGIGADYAL